MFQGWPWGASHLNWQIIRYADVLLWKAEALIEIGEATGLEEARKIINRIRLRAKNSPYVKDFKHSEQVLCPQGITLGTPYGVCYGR